MIYKNIFLALFCIYSFPIQSQSYDFSVTTEPYSNLVGSTSLNNNAPWDDPEYVIPIGFNFNYFNTTITEFYLKDWGDGAALSSLNLGTGITSVLTAYGADIADRAYNPDNPNATTGALSNISYLVAGNAGNRILKIEWKNVGYYDEILDFGTANDFTNFQLWLFEGSNTIEVHFGPNSITDPDTVFTGESGASISLIPYFDIDNELFGSQPALELTGPPSAPNLVSSTVFDETFLNGVIPNGTVYRFSNNTLNVKEFATTNSSIKLIPNPAYDVFSLKSNNDASINKLSILSLSGALIKEINRPVRTVDISFLSQGIYYVKIEYGANNTTKRLVKL